MDREKVINELNECIEHIRKNKFNKIPFWGNCQSAMMDAVALLKEQEHKDKMFHALEEDWKTMLKEQEAVEPRVSTSEQRCGHCNKVIEMDGWQSCPWCGKRIDWKGWWKKNGTRNQDT